VGTKLDRIAFIMERKKAKAERGNQYYGFVRASLGEILALGQGGSRVLHDKGELDGIGVQYIVTDADRAASPATTERLARKTGGSVLSFGAKEQVVHAMVSPEDNPNRWSVEQVARTISSALAGQRTSQVVP
jgi:hypothetical protein